MRRFLLLAFFAAASAPAASAQEISLTELADLSALPADLSPATSEMTVNLPEWVFRPETVIAQEEKLTWAWWPPAESGGLPPAQLSLRPNHQNLDVLLYLHRVAVFNHLRRDLERQHLTPVAVTCLGPGCTGERFTTSTYTVAFYQGKPGDYPYMVVIQPKPKPGGAAAPAPSKQATVLARP